MDDGAPDVAWMLAFLAGGVVGAGLALLLAPQSGKGTREMMSRKLRAAADAARGLKDRAGAAASAVAGDGQPGTTRGPGVGPRI